jgi:hypothetical protein
MKNIIVIALLVIASACQAWAQNIPFSTPTGIDTVNAAGTAYAANQMIRGTTANAIVIKTAVPSGNAGGSVRIGEIKWVKVQIDSLVGNVLIEVYALSDTAGMGALLTVDHADAQFRAQMGDNLIGSFVTAFSTLGTTAGGSARSYANYEWRKDYRLPTGKSNIYWLFVTRSACTIKQRAAVRVTPDLEARS